MSRENASPFQEFSFFLPIINTLYTVSLTPWSDYVPRDGAITHIIYWQAANNSGSGDFCWKSSTVLPRHS